MTKVTLPTIQQPLVDSSGRCNVLWFEKFKFLEGLQPLSDVDFAAIDAAIALKSDILRKFNTQTGTSYSLQASDSGKVVLFTNSSAVTFDIPALGIAPTAGGIMQVDILQFGTGKVTLTPALGVSIASKASYKSTGGQYSASTLLNVGTDSWVLFGDIIA